MSGSDHQELPPQWLHLELNAFGELYCGQSPSVAEVNHDQRGLPYITGPEQWDGHVLHINKWTEHPRRIVPPGCIFVTVKGAGVGKMFSGVAGAIGRDVYAFRPYTALDYHYVFYAVKFSIDQIIIQAQGDIPGLSKSHILDHKIGLPGIQEQHRIVAKIEELISELDKGVESLNTAKEQLKVYRQAVLKHAFEGKLTEQWRDKNQEKLESADQLLARIESEHETLYQQQLEEWKSGISEWETHGKIGNKPSKPTKPDELSTLSADELAELPPLPKGHLYTPLANLGDLGRGKSKHRPRNDPKLFGGTYPFIQTGEVKAANRIVREYSQTYNEVGLAQSKLWPKGTLCITIAANIAETAFLGFDGCFPDSVVGFTARSRLVLPEYVELFIKAVRIRIEAYAAATAQKNINLTTLENLVVPVCSMEEQRLAVSEVQAMLSVTDKIEGEIEANLARTEILRQSILKKAFSGKLVAQDPNDESASVLLERIKAEKAEEASGRKNNNRKDAA